MTSPQTPRHGEFAAALAEAIERRGVALSWVRDRLVARGTPVSLAALSYWRSGQREPEREVSLEAVAELEVLLDLEPGALSRRLRGRERAGGPVPFDSLIDQSAASDERGETDVDRVLVHQYVDVGADRRITRRRVLQVHVAAVDGPEAVTLYLGPAVVKDGAVARVEPVSGCRVGETRTLPSGSRAVRLEFDRPLVRGESVATEVEIVGADSPQPAAQAGVAAEQRLEECMVWVRFHPDALPSRCFVSFSEGELEHEWEVALDGSTGVHHRQTSFGPGVCLVRWEW